MRALTPRHIEIARHIASGLTNKQIAKVLGISPWTVKCYLQVAFLRSGARTRAQYVAVALKERQVWE